MTKSEIQFIRSLSSPGQRQQAGVFVCEGVKLFTEMVASRLRIRKIYATEQFERSFDAGEIEGLAGDLPEIERVSGKEMERISSLKTATAVLVLVEIPRCKLVEADASKSLVLALDEIQDPGNLGTIIRLADWFGIADVVCSESTVDCFNHKVIQATMGAIARVRIHYTSLGDYLAAQAVAGVHLYGTFLDGEDIYQSNLTTSGIIVMGSEGKGVRPEIAARISHKLFIPPYPAHSQTSESLNVAVATAIICSEFRRRG